MGNWTRKMFIFKVKNLWKAFSLWLVQLVFVAVLKWKPEPCQWEEQVPLVTITLTKSGKVHMGSAGGSGHRYSDVAGWSVALPQQWSLLIIIINIDYY